MPAAANVESIVVDELATLIANCATTLTFLGVADATAALAAIKQFEREGAGRPLILVSDTDNIEFILENADWPKGELWVLFEKDVAAADAADPVNARRAFTNLTGAIMNEALVLANGGGYLAVTNFRRASKPARSHPKEKTSGEGDYFQVTYRVQFGLES